jgi:dTDP-4-amino-4,6-dideoxygalactose transaminase
MRTKPAALGGKPAFDTRVSLVRPALPEFESLAAGVKDCLDTGMVTKGRYLREFEAALAGHLGVKHAVCVSSCTTGLMLAYQGLGLTGDVVVPSFTFMATVSAMVWAGLRPVFADVHAGTTNLDPAAAEAAITPETSAVVAVHNFGNPAEVDALQAVCDRHGLPLLFDAAHGFGASYRGTPVGRQGAAQVFSMSPTKLLVAGEGGLVATQDDDLAGRVRTGREYGNGGNYDSAFAGINARMAEYNALLGLRGLDLLERAAARRNEAAGLYRGELGGLPGLSFQEVRPGDRCSYKDFSVVVDPEAFGLTRDELALALDRENIDTRKYYDPPVHRQAAYRRFDDGRPLPNTDRLARDSLSLPIWSRMGDETVRTIALAVRRVRDSAARVRDALGPEPAPAPAPAPAGGQGRGGRAGGPHGPP